MQVFQVLDGLMVDVPAIAAWTGARKAAVLGFPGSVADGFQSADYTTARQVGAIAGRSAGRAAWVATCIAKGVQVSAIAAYRLSVQYWAEHGAEYRAVAQFVWALWMLQAREVMGCDTSEESALAVSLLPEVVAIQGRLQSAVQAISHSRWVELRDWVLSVVELLRGLTVSSRPAQRAIAKYEAMRLAFWLVSVAK